MKIVTFSLAALAAIALSSGSVSAQYGARGGHQHGHQSHKHGAAVSPGFGGYNTFARPSLSFGASLYSPGFGGYGSLYTPYPRGHYHYVPGHFDYHRGHYHYHPGHYDYHVPGTPRPRH